MKDTFNEIFDYVKTLDIIDTHEHLPYREELRNFNADILSEYLVHYFNRDLMSAGLSKDDFVKVCNTEIPIMERWELVEPYWEDARNTGYGRALDITVKELYDVDSINRNTIEEVNEKFKESLKIGQFNKVLKEKSKIVTSLLDHPQSLESDDKFFTKVYHMDHFVYPKGGYVISAVERESGMTVLSMDDFFEAIEKVIDNVMEKGVKVFKCALAYDRLMKFDRYTRHEAEEEFNHIYTKSNYYIDRDQQVYCVGKPFQDYAMHYFLKLANRRNLTVQFHMGLHEGNGNIISNSNPEHMSNLFLEYPNVNFDIFHIGYPYQHVLSALGKKFPNVFIDMCWAHIISPTACVNSLVEWLDVMPINKISAFGGDYGFVDAVYGHQYIARENVSKALAIKVNEGKFDIERAKHIAKKLFYDNPVRIFKLNL